MKIILTSESIQSLVEELYPQNIKNNDYEVPSIKLMNHLLADINPKRYASTRNYLQGSVTRLSRYISSGVISVTEVVNQLLKDHDFDESFSLLQQLLWRAYFKHVLSFNPNASTQSIGPYKTGYNESDYSKKLPEDIINAKTPNLIINHFISTLIHEGYLHNHARLYLASYIVHYRRIHWSVGAQWMFYHLVDADIASNNLSWQWVASTSSNKPYIFNLENIQKFVPSSLPTSKEDNPELFGSYEELAKRLFPRQGDI